MSVKLYDDAIVESFRSLMQDNRISILPVEQALRFSAQLQRDDIRFPLISTYRLGYSIRENDVNYYGLNTGGYRKRNDNGTNTFVQIVPIKINYQLDIFTVDRESCDNIIRELVFYLLQTPSLTVKIPYDINMEHRFNLYMEPDIVDNSDTVEHTNKGVLFRNTLNLYTDDAYLFSNRTQLHGNVSGNVHTI